jgi:hypothetical protein
MKKKFTYTPNLTGLNIIKNETEQHEKFFCNGHPDFLIPDFCEDPSDIWLSFLDFLEKEIGDELWDQNGGEVQSEGVISPDGLTKCVYSAYDIQKTEDEEDLENFDVEVTGYVVENPSTEEIYFVATKVKIKTVE